MFGTPPYREAASNPLLWNLARFCHRFDGPNRVEAIHVSLHLPFLSIGVLGAPSGGVGSTRSSTLAELKPLIDPSLDGPGWAQTPDLPHQGPGMGAEASEICRTSSLPAACRQVMSVVRATWGMEQGHTPLSPAPGPPTKGDTIEKAGESRPVCYGGHFLGGNSKDWFPNNPLIWWSKEIKKQQKMMLKIPAKITFLFFLLDHFT